MRHLGSRRRRMRAATAVLLFGLPLAVAAPARADDGEESPFHAGAWAISFGGSPFSEEPNIELSLRRHVSEHSAIRLGLAAFYQNADGNGDLTNQLYVGGILQPGPPATHMEREFSNQGYLLTLHWRRYGLVAERFVLFGDLGPTARYFSNSSNTDFVNSDGRSRSEQTGVQRGVGADAGIGFEWIFHHRLSLGGRVGATAVYVWGSSTFSNDVWQYTGDTYQLYRDRENPHGITAQITHATFALNAYF